MAEKANFRLVLCPAVSINGLSRGRADGSRMVRSLHLVPGTCLTMVGIEKILKTFGDDYMIMKVYTNMSTKHAVPVV